MEGIQEIFTNLDALAEKSTLLKFVWLNEQVQVLSNEIGFAPDQLKYVLSLLAAYPLAVVYSSLPSAALKHVYSFVTGIAFAQFVLGSGWIHSFLTATVTYILVRICPAKYAPYIVFLFNMAYLSLSHIYRVYVDYMGWTLDFTGPQMILVIKLTSFAYNYYDGVTDEKRINSNPPDKALARVYASRKTFAIKKLPSMLEYYGYVYCFSNFLAGPAFEIKEYLDVTNGTKFIFNGKQQYPSKVVPAFKKLLAGLVCIGLFTVGASKYPISATYGEKMASYSFYQRVVFCWITLFFVRMKYYFAWKVAEGSTVLAGFGFEGFNADGSAKGWNGVSNMDIVSFELAQNVREGSRSWNKGTQAWLERYVYSRTGNSLTATYFCSAFWHGFYPGYYLFFMSVPLATSVNRLSFKRLRPWFLEKNGTSGLKKRVYDFLSVVATSLCLNYLVLSFQALALEYSMTVWTHFYFSGHIILIILYALYSFIPMRKLRSD